MNKFYIYAVVIALIATAIAEKCCQSDLQPAFNPILDHSEIKAHFTEVEQIKVKWTYNKGDAYGHLIPHTDTILIEDY